jgi:hypothetical protein
MANPHPSPASHRKKGSPNKLPAQMLARNSERVIAQGKRLPSENLLLVAENCMAMASTTELGSITTTRFTRTRHSDIVHPVSSSQLTEARDRVRSFAGYNTSRRRCLASLKAAWGLHSYLPALRLRLPFFS